MRNMLHKSWVAFGVLMLLAPMPRKIETKELGHLSLPTTRGDGSPKIINGTEADWHGTRYQVSLRLQSSDWFFGAGHICGGSLITRDTVLTAAHCIWNTNNNSYRKANEFVVVMGNLNRYLRDNTLSFGVKHISTMHSTFNMTTYADDLAVLWLNSAVPSNFTRSEPIALNTQRNLGDGTLCSVSGWGQMENGGYAANLMITDVPIINSSACATNYGELLAEGMLCAGYMAGERDACTGDSGGPLVCDGRLAGVVSFGAGCAEPGYPGVYADVAHYESWIRNEIGWDDEFASSGVSWIPAGFLVIAVPTLSRLFAFF